MNYDYLSDSSSETISYENKNIPIHSWTAYSTDFAGLSEVNHWHNDFEFIYLKDGDMFFNINGEEIHVDNHNLLIINSGTMHFGFQKKKVPNELLCMQCHPTLIADDYVGKYLSVLCGKNSPSYLLLSGDKFTDRTLIESYLSLCSITEKEDDGYEFAALGKFYSIFAELYSRISSSSDKEPENSLTVEIMHLMTGFIQREFNSRITIADIAAAGLVCRSKCCSIFKSFLGKTPVEYLTEYRLSKSLELLRSTDMSITEISGKCGFSGSSYFTEVFVKNFGFTPTDYRKSLHANMY